GVGGRGGARGPAEGCPSHTAQGFAMRTRPAWVQGSPMRADNAARELALRFEGEELAFVDGDSVAAVLIDAGRLTCRIGRSGAPRGVFCGMGVCQEGAVLVDGIPARACMTAARDGSLVEILPAEGPP